MAKVKTFRKRNRKNKTFRKRNRNRSKKILYGGLLSRGAGVICQVYSTTGIDEDERATAVVLESTEDGKVTVKMDDGRIKTYPHEDLILPNISALPADLRWAVQQQENAPLTSEQRVQLGLRFPEDTISAGGERNFSSKHFLPTTEHK